MHNFVHRPSENIALDIDLIDSRRHDGVLKQHRHHLRATPHFISVSEIDTT